MNDNEHNVMQPPKEMWEFMSSRKSFFLYELEKETGYDKGTISKYVWSMVADGCLEEADLFIVDGRRTRKLRLTKEYHSAPLIYGRQTDEKDRNREHIWRWMRILESFTVFDLFMSCSTDDHPIRLEEVEVYVRYLQLSGYVRRRQTWIEGREILVLSRWTGPKPPRVKVVRQLYDPNTDKVVLREPARIDRRIEWNPFLT